MAHDRFADNADTDRHDAPDGVDEALATMAHDARNGLATIITRAQLLARRARRPDPMDPQVMLDGLAEIERLAKRVAARVREIEHGVHVGSADGGDADSP